MSQIKINVEKSMRKSDVWGVPEGVLLKQNEGLKSLLFFEVPRVDLGGRAISFHISITKGDILETCSLAVLAGVRYLSDQTSISLNRQGPQ